MSTLRRISLALFALSVFVAANSFWSLQQVSWLNAGGDRVHLLRVWNGSLCVIRLHSGLVRLNQSTRWQHESRTRELLAGNGDWPWPDEFLSADHEVNAWGFTYSHGWYRYRSGSDTFDRVEVPLWALLVLSGMLPLAALIRRGRCATVGQG